MALTWKILKSSGDPYADTGGHGRFIIRKHPDGYALTRDRVRIGPIFASVAEAQKYVDEILPIITESGDTA